MNEAHSTDRMGNALKSILPQPLRTWLSGRRRDLRRALLPFDRVTDFSTLRRVKPYRPAFGWDRGECIDRYYIESFLEAHRDDIRGRVLEVGSDEYTRRFGGQQVTCSDVIDVNEQNPARTITADLSRCNAVADNVFDCVICTQTLQLIYDSAAAVRELYRIVAPGGVLLVTLPGISQDCPPRLHAGACTDYWRFTQHAARRMFAECFGEENTAVTTYGNVLAGVAFLHGLVVAELTAEELDYHDPEVSTHRRRSARKTRDSAP